MKLISSTALATTLVALTMAAPITNGTNTTDTCHEYSIDNFAYNLQYTAFYSLVSFTISNTEAATPNFVCSPAETDFEPGSVYTCTQEPTFSFSYNPATNDLSLWEQTDSGVVTGNAVIGSLDYWFFLDEYWFSSYPAVCPQHQSSITSPTTASTTYRAWDLDG